jgi:phosphoserine aminotransferase
VCVYRQRNNKNLTVLHQYGKRDKVVRKMVKDKRRGKMMMTMMLKSECHNSLLNW